MTTIGHTSQGSYQNVGKGEAGDEPRVQCLKTICVCNLLKYFFRLLESGRVMRRVASAFHWRGLWMSRMGRRSGLITTSGHWVNCFCKRMTFSIMMLSITTPRAMTSSVTTLSIVTLSNIPLSIMMLSIATLCTITFGITPLNFQYCDAQNNSIQCNDIQYNNAQYNDTQHSDAQQWHSE